MGEDLRAIALDMWAIGQAPMPVPWGLLVWLMRRQTKIAEKTSAGRHRCVGFGRVYPRHVPGICVLWGWEFVCIENNLPDIGWTVRCPGEFDLRVLRVKLR